MSLVFQQLRVYFRVTVALIVTVSVLMVLIMNRGPNHAASVWFFGLTEDEKPVNVVWIMLCTALGTLVSWWTLALCRGLWRELHELKQSRLLREAAKGVEQRKAVLEERERRIDEKIERAIRAEEPPEEP